MPSPPAPPDARSAPPAVPLELRAEGLEVGARLRGVHCAIAAGECVVVVGPNGAGKSTLVRTLLGLERPDRGQVTLAGLPLAQLTPRQRAAHVAWLPQRPHLADSLSVEELVASARYRFGESRGEARAHALRALDRVAAAPLLERRIDQVSGGELQRVLLAALLAQETPLCLVDEPANHLDPAHQMSLYALLGQLWRQGRGLLVVTHDINLARFLGDPQRVRVLGLRAGQLECSCTLADPALGERLGELYGVPFRALSLDGDRHWVALPAPAPSSGTEGSRP